MSADPLRLVVAPSETHRLAAALIALGVGLPAIFALMIGLLEPSSGASYFLAAGLFLAVGAAGGLWLRLLRERRTRRAMAERFEALQDLSWELSDAGSQKAAEAMIPIATVSHEMRAPLHGVLALVDLLAGTELSAEQRAYVSAVRQSAGALARLVDDLLDASRIATGQFTLQPAPAEIEALVEDIAELLAPLAHERGIGLGTRVAPNLPPVMVDAGRLRQILINLLTNAIAATEQGSVLLAVDPADSIADEGIALGFAVHDSGLGVDSDDRDRIFASFERARVDGTGLGLGLAISQQIVSRMGGHIALEARAGGGAVFHFTLGLAPLGHPPRAARPLDGEAVLLVAPPGLESEALGSALEEAGAETRLVGSLSEATGLVGAAAAAGQPYRMVLADARIAIDAQVALKRLRDAAGGRLAVGIMIESRDRRAVDALKDDGFDAYLMRPVRRRSLVAVVGEAIHRPARFVADPADEPHGIAPERRGRRPLDVLVVEDDPVSALLARAVLERLGHEVSEVRTLVAAKARLADPPDVVLVDLRLGDGDGLDLVRAFASPAAERARPAMIATSGNGDAANEAAALAAGADLFLEKPISAERLGHAFEKALSRRSVALNPRHQTA
ncbi:Signal transduction histidine kinase [Kaistia soli DSM 19436]|uniref:histidine kinase n=1 Tax=Kaistia soli DSM 19436 TaxID=1122133 RepID=A0A1M5CZM5_9HYPH|nr:response regulator [Kaistia soli]SHF59962.1 Signal transduction histidine kinase [Kaistia soli DSM 19436]